MTFSLKKSANSPPTHLQQYTSNHFTIHVHQAEEVVAVIPCDTVVGFGRAHEGVLQVEQEAVLLFSGMYGTMLAVSARLQELGPVQAAVACYTELVFVIFLVVVYLFVCCMQPSPDTQRLVLSLLLMPSFLFW